jgi:hypothetical protein
MPGWPLKHGVETRAKYERYTLVFFSGAFLVFSTLSQFLRGVICKVRDVFSRIRARKKPSDNAIQAYV